MNKYFNSRESDTKMPQSNDNAISKLDAEVLDESLSVPWLDELAKNPTEVDLERYAHAHQQQSNSRSTSLAATPNASPKPPSKKKPKTSTVVTPSPKKSAKTKAKKKGGRRSRCRSPARKRAGEPTEFDVFLGRGSRTNKHKGNRDYLLRAAEMTPQYQAASKNDKKGIALQLVTWVHARGGRFVKKTGNQWYEVDDEHTVRNKCSQALRDAIAKKSRAEKKAAEQKNSTNPV